MTRIAELDDVAVEKLLQGDAPTGCEDLAPIAELAGTVRQTATARRPEMSPALRAQIRQRPAVPPRYAGAARRRLQVAVAAVTLAVVGVAAAQNALPAAAQRAVAAAADLVGIHVPRPDGDLDEPSTSTDADQDSGTTGAPAGSADAPDAEGADDPGASSGSDPTSGNGGPPEETPGGATPADPGTPGDREPATPATPPTTLPTPPTTSTDSERGAGSANGSGSANGTGKAAPGPLKGQGAPVDGG